MLLNSVLGVPLDTQVRDRIIAETHGNPLALLEWPRGLTLADLAGGFGLPKVALAGQIQESFRRRLTELPHQLGDSSPWRRPSPPGTPPRYGGRPSSSASGPGTPRRP